MICCLFCHQEFALDDWLMHNCIAVDAMRALGEYNREIFVKKKPYSKPKLTVYGNIRDMTESSTGRHHHRDAGHGRSAKTA